MRDRREGGGWYLNFVKENWANQTGGLMWPWTVFTDSRPAVPSVCLCCCCLCPRPTSAPWTWMKCRWPMRTERPNLIPHLMQDKTMERFTGYKVQDSSKENIMSLSINKVMSSSSSSSSFLTQYSPPVPIKTDNNRDGGCSYLSNLPSSVHSCSFPPSRSPPHK